MSQESARVRTSFDRKYAPTHKQMGDNSTTVQFNINRNSTTILNNNNNLPLYPLRQRSSLGHLPSPVFAHTKEHNSNRYQCHVSRRLLSSHYIIAPRKSCPQTEEYSDNKHKSGGRYTHVHVYVHNARGTSLWSPPSLDDSLRGLATARSVIILFVIIWRRGGSREGETKISHDRDKNSTMIPKHNFQSPSLEISHPCPRYSCPRRSFLLLLLL